MTPALLPRSVELGDILQGLRAEQHAQSKILQEQNKVLDQQNGVLAKQDVTLEKQNLLLVTMQSKLQIAEQSYALMADNIEKMSKSLIDTGLKLCEIVSILDRVVAESKSANVTHESTARRSRRKNPGVPRARKKQT